MNHEKEVRLAGAVLSRSRHVCVFYHSQGEEYQILLPFIKEGFERGDKIFHIIDDRNRQEHLLRELQERRGQPATADERERHR